MPKPPLLKTYVSSVPHKSDVVAVYSPSNSSTSGGVSNVKDLVI